IGHPHSGNGYIHSRRLHPDNKTWYYPKIIGPSLGELRQGGSGCKSKSKRTGLLSALAAREADAEIGRPAGWPAAAYAGAAAGGGGRPRRDRRRLVHPA